MDNNETNQTQHTWLLLISIMLAILAGQLLADKQLGLNFIVFESLCLITMIFLRKKYHQTITKNEVLLIISAGLFSLCLIFRDSPVLYGLNLLAVFVIVMLAFGQRYTGSLADIPMLSWLYTPYYLIRISVISVFKLISIGLKPSLLLSQEKKMFRSIFLGIVWALPVLLLLGSLLISSDRRFEEFTMGLFLLDLDGLFNTALYFPMVCGFFYSTILASEITIQQKKESSFQLDSVQLITMLSLVNILFLSYILVQFSYFFGGEKIVMQATNISYSSYARRGFWELIFLAMLVIPLLLIAHWSQRLAQHNLQKWFNYLALIMLICLMIIEASAVHRMFLYVTIYSLTELRFYSSLFMFYMMTGLITFYFTVLADKRGRFIALMVSQALVIIFLLNLINPDAQIARYNISHQYERAVDTSYLENLSSDAFLTIYNMRSAFDRKKSCWLQQQLSYKLNDTVITWYQWNWSVHYATQVMADWQQECRK